MTKASMPIDMQALDQTVVGEVAGKYLTFWTDRQLFGVSIAHVVQIVGMQDITEVPEFPYYAKGVINLRGLVIPIIDIRLRLGKQEAEYNERTCIIVTDINGGNVGVIVDEVDAVSVISKENIAPPPQLSGGSTQGYITGIGKMESRVVLLIDSQKIVGQEDLALLSNLP